MEYINITYKAYKAYKAYKDNIKIFICKYLQGLQGSDLSLA